MTGQIRLWAVANSGRDLLSSHVESLSGLVSQLDLGAIERVGELLDQTCRQGRTIFSVGNGGSAATALHIAADLAWGRRMGDEQRPRAVSLVANPAVMTALANDVGYADVFVEQLKGPFNAGDILIAISASGNSENVLRAVEYANDRGGTTIGLVGFDGGRLKGISQHCIHVATPTGAYELVEDVHHAVCHMLANYVKFKSANRADDTENTAR